MRTADDLPSGEAVSDDRFPLRESGLLETEGAPPESESHDSFPVLFPPEFVAGGNPGTIAGYRLVRELGRGGMGVVYEAIHLTLGRRAAVKVLRPELALRRRYVRRFLQEACLAASIDHPNIVAVHDAGRAGSSLYLAMSLVLGVDLGRWLQHGRRLTLCKALDLFEQVFEGLEAIQRAGMIHRDIKPANLLIEATTHRVKIADLGLARDVLGTPVESHHEIVQGTPAYMSPEQAEGLAQLDIRTDIYSAGMSMYQAVTGALPLASESPMRTLARILYEDVPDPRVYTPDLPESVALFLKRATARRREDRFSSAHEAHGVLKSVIASLPCVDAIVAFDEGPTEEMEPSHRGLLERASEWFVRFVTPPPDCPPRAQRKSRMANVRGRPWRRCSGGAS